MLRGAALAGVVGTVPVLAACGGDEAGTASEDATHSAESTAASDAATGTGNDGISTSAVEPGQAVLVEAAGTTVILAQPMAGEFKAYDVTCPHKGCKVAPKGGLALACPCHGSAFDATNGSVTNGPATTGLTERAVTVEGDQLTIT